MPAASKPNPQKPENAMHSSTEFAPYLTPTGYIDSDHPAIAAYAEEKTTGLLSDVEKAVALFYAVRDDIIYDPYQIEFTETGMKASRILERKRGYCVAKAVLLTAVARAAAIPARLGFADVKNHLSTKRLREYMGTDLFVYHGYTELFLSGKWIKATPTFNQSLCDKFHVKPLEFDGKADALFHAHTPDGRQHMEYVTDHGHFADLPVSRILEASLAAYPFIREYLGGKPVTGNFEREAEEEGRAKPGGGP